MSQGEEQRLHFEQAIETILSHSAPGRRVAELPITEATGLVLAEEVHADTDMPAFNRAAMDGFAFRHADHLESRAFRIVGSVAAGDHGGSAPTLAKGECVKIMTGAAVPDDADVVIPVEETSGFAGKDATVRFHAIPALGTHIAPRGQDLRNGQVVLKVGTLLRSQEVAILASVGRRSVRVFTGPRIAFSATGKELREPGEALVPGCIRNSNAYCLWSQILNARAKPNYLGILADDPDALRAGLAKGLDDDLLIISGGVSMGEYDFVPRILEELGVKLLF